MRTVECGASAATEQWIQGRRLKLRTPLVADPIPVAYDETGRAVSQHSTTSSTQTGGDAAYEAGYNTGNLIAQLWNNPQRLAASVFKDVQNDSMKSAKK
jgi:hypothetical protein